MTRWTCNTYSVIFSILIAFITLNIYLIKINIKKREWGVVLTHIALMLVGLIAFLFVSIYFW